MLPFTYLGTDADDECLADGLTDELITALTRVAGLKVVARTSSFKFKGHAEDIRSISSTLRVDTVLEGSVRRQNGHPREVMPRAQAYARKAIELDPLIAEAYCSFAMIENAWEWDTQQCGVQFRRCLELNPNNAMAAAKYATSYLHPVCRFEEGEKWLRRALILDPLSPLVRADLACNLVHRVCSTTLSGKQRGCLKMIRRWRS